MRVHSGSWRTDGRKRRPMVTIRMTHYAWWMDEEQALLTGLCQPANGLHKPKIRGAKLACGFVSESWERANKQTNKKNLTCTAKQFVDVWERESWEEQCFFFIFYHRTDENLVQERAADGSLGSMTPISCVYQRRSIGPLRVAFSRKKQQQQNKTKDHLDPTSPITVN